MEQRRGQRLRSGTQDAHVESFDFDAAATLVRQFNTLRPWFPRNYLCLFDSLALLELLARYHLFPSWVFGVHAEPFEAHCWVQQHDVVLNDTLARVERFAPIMAV